MTHPRRTGGNSPRKRSGGAASSRAGGGGSRGFDPRNLGGEQIEGRQAVRELLRAGKRRVRELLVAEGIDEATPVVAEILDLARDARVVVKRVGRARLDAESRSEAPQGVLARTTPLDEHDVDDLARRRGNRVPFLVILDGITDPQNLGAILRTAEQAGATGVVLPRHRAAHVTPTVAKAAAGAIEHLPIAVVPGVPGALKTLGDRGVWRVGLEGEAESSIFDLELATEPVAIVLGAEGAGLSRLTRQRCDVLAAIPQRGRLDSLNVSAAAAVACYEVTRRRTSN